MERSQQNWNFDQHNGRLNAHDNAMRVLEDKGADLLSARLRPVDVDK
jgi:hypothetical protein